MEFKGTKGEWKVNRNNIQDLPEAEFEIEGNNMQVAISFDYNDAKLIAAAPYLLEALQFSLKILKRTKDPIFSHRLAINKAEQAINKALK